MIILFFRISVPVRHWLHSALPRRADPPAGVKINSTSKMGGRPSKGQGRLSVIIYRLYFFRFLIFSLVICSSNPEICGSPLFILFSNFPKQQPVSKVSEALYIFFDQKVTVA